MANTLIPFEERGLSPSEVNELDRRRRKGHLFLVLGWQFLIISIFVTLWAGQDLTYSPGWTHPMAYWDLLVFVMAVIFFGIALRMRRGVNEFFSY
jgi:uncharacterized membrane protein YccC